jgi:hypothetical protein
MAWRKNSRKGNSENRQLLAQLRAIFAVDLPLRRLFAAPSVVRLSERIAMLQWRMQDQERRDDLGADYEKGTI